jgi:sulfate adenylyltransferase large subunit
MPASSSAPTAAPTHAATDAGLLRIATAGSVDDGKSTLIGRLLHDSKSIMADQLQQVQRASERRHGGDGAVDLALLTDGLRAEREQGITIDVAYRYFATPRRSFIIADTPGHVSYTRNMVTGASTADVAVVLVDARHGIVEQSRRHACISALLGIRHVVLAVNKLDLADWSRDTFTGIVADFTTFAADLGFAEVQAIPMCARDGDNVVDPSSHTPWYDGPTLLTYLETVDATTGHDLDLDGTARLPVQWVVRPGAGAHADYRGYAGQLARGVLRPGDPVVVLPAGTHTTVAAIDTFDGPLDAAGSGDAITVLLADDVDVARGDVIASVVRPPHTSRDLEAVLCWMHETPLRPGARYRFKHTTRTGRADVIEVTHRVDIATLALDTDAEALELNELGRVRLHTSETVTWDAYAHNRAMGSLILIDEASGATVAAGMLVEPDSPAATPTFERARLAGLAGATVWLTGVAADGGAALASAVTHHLVQLGLNAYHLRADALPHDLGADVTGIDAHTRAARAAALLADVGVLAIVSGGGPAAQPVPPSASATVRPPFLVVQLGPSTGAAQLALDATDAPADQLALVLALLGDHDLLGA